MNISRLRQFAENLIFYIDRLIFLIARLVLWSFLGLCVFAYAILTYALICVTAVVAVLGILGPLGDQVMTWLKTGNIPPRDLYWAIAGETCAITNGQWKVPVGKDTCRTIYIQFTGWV